MDATQGRVELVTLGIAADGHVSVAMATSLECRVWYRVCLFVLEPSPREKRTAFRCDLVSDYRSKIRVATLLVVCFSASLELSWNSPAQFAFQTKAAATSKEGSPVKDAKPAAPAARKPPAAASGRPTPPKDLGPGKKDAAKTAAAPAEKKQPEKKAVTPSKVCVCVCVCVCLRVCACVRVCVCA